MFPSGAGAFTGGKKSGLRRGESSRDKGDVMAMMMMVIDGAELLLCCCYRPSSVVLRSNYP